MVSRPPLGFRGGQDILVLFNPGATSKKFKIQGGPNLQGGQENPRGDLSNFGTKKCTKV